ncbi:LytR/AlgR family response regulator transcription factor [Chitinophagaceae bacterium MMS25-I14]
MLQAIAIDDEPPALRLLEAFCSQSADIALQKTFTQPGEALKYLRKYPVDLVFLDIQMPSISGIDFVNAMQQENIMVIFTTAYSEYAVEGFNLNAVDYLLKPYSPERFIQAVAKARDFYNFQHQAEKTKQQDLFIRADYSLVKIPLTQILYIEGLGDYLKIYWDGGKPVIARMTMKTIMERLPAKDFVRIHRSFIIPFHRIEQVRNKTITLAGGTELPVGSSYEEDFFSRFHA